MNAVFFLLFSWGMVRARSRHQVLALTMPHEKRRKNTAFIVYYLHFEKITGSISIRTLPRGRPLSR